MTFLVIEPMELTPSFAKRSKRPVLVATKPLFAQKMGLATCSLTPGNLCFFPLNFIKLKAIHFRDLDEIDFDTAYDACVIDEEMLLPEVRNEFQWHAFSTLIYDNQLRKVWLGFGDADDEGTYIFYSDGKEQTFFNWLGANPNEADTVNSDCVMTESWLGGWNDRPCQQKKAEKIICQEP